MSILKTENLTCIYGKGTPYERTAVNNVSLTIEKGGITGIIGHTGSGKSTLIQHFNGLMKPYSGRVLLDGKDIWEGGKIMPGLRFRVGLVFQYPEYQLFEETVYRDIAFGPGNMKLDQAEIDARVHEAAELFGIDEKMLSSSPFELSGGQKRRVAIAGVMAMRPEVIIFDEPAAGLDPKGRRSVFELIEKYSRETGCTVIIVSHSMEDMAGIADRLIVMNQGSLFCHCPVDEVFSRSDELTAMGLDVPQITRVFSGLKKIGLAEDDSIYTVGQAVNCIMERLGKKGGDSPC
ncbi:energy-coupling factor transporter ATPase [Ruminococcus sp. HUN007]|uniref:energy-coupling factor transporter ATPase n=1 Tax=Ruminococcus sp. HUN007 TaxID=1514668 RepID=UPI0005D150D4|nr:energy-coupling factor transporter ATPase [Ruminococcus sp. HUN007]